MMRLVGTPEELPPGSHSISLYATRPEAAHNMASFLKGAQDRRQSAMILTADDEMLSLYREVVSKEVPEMLGALRRIEGPHIRPTADGWRPVDEVGAFASAHPEGATMCGDTIPDLLSRRTLASLLAYEDWFDGLRPFYHRGLCPYNLSAIPVDRASQALVGLSRAHTHAVLSKDPDPATQFLQLLVLPLVENPPKEHLGWLARAVDRGLVEEHRGDDGPVTLTSRGENFTRALRGLPALTRGARAPA
jgi:hypothetical protein